MSEAPLRAFIPVWLDDAGLSPAEFRLYGHLCRKAKKETGVAWPSYESMMEVCGMSRRTIHRTLQAIEKRGLIKNIGKPFGGSCRYQVLASMVPNQESNSAKWDTIEEPPIVPKTTSNSVPNGTPIVPPGAREGITNEGKPIRETNRDKDLGDLLKLEVSTKKPSCDQLAESIYQEYPRKVSKPVALKAIKNALKTHPAEFLLEKVKTYASAIAWKDPQYIPHPATWFNGERWEDDPAEWEQPATRPQSQNQPPIAKARANQSHEEDV